MVVQRFIRGLAEVVQSRCRCRGGVEVQSCRGVEVQLRFSRGGVQMRGDCGGAEVVQRGGGGACPWWCVLQLQRCRD